MVPVSCLENRILNFYQTILALTGNCWTASNNTNGAKVVLGKCTLGSPSQNWTFSAGATPHKNGLDGIGTVKIFGDKCLDVTNGVDADGTHLQIWECTSDNRNQIWWLSPGEKGVQNVKWAGDTTKCVDLTGGIQKDGTPVSGFLHTFGVDFEYT
jgi:Ricin-type beta-trefoil lectin domain